MESITLKELSAYLPYGVTAIDTYLSPTHFILNGILRRCVTGYALKDSHHKDEVNSVYFFHNGGRVPIKRSHKQFKLVLRPLSDLTKEIEVNGEMVIPIEKITTEVHNLKMYQFVDNKIYCLNYGKFIDITGLPYLVVIKLLEWHFDVFKLIDRGLAIDLNSI